MQWWCQCMKGARVSQVPVQAGVRGSTAGSTGAQHPSAHPRFFGDRLCLVHRRPGQEVPIYCLQ